MLASLINWQRQQSIKIKLLSFLDEMDKNLELFYVMDQRQFILNGFHDQQWKYVKDLDLIKGMKCVSNYVDAIKSFNQFFTEFKAYEQWYTGDVKNKNQDNAKKLHTMKHELDMKLKGMEIIIIPAGQELERELLKLGYIKNE